MLRHRELADVVQERGDPHSFDLVVWHAGGSCERGRPGLDPADVVDAAAHVLDRLIAGVDGSRECFDAGEVEIRDFLQMPLLFGEAPDVQVIRA